MLAASFHKWYNHQQRQMATGAPSSRYQPPVIDDDQLEYMIFLLEEACELQKRVIVTYAGKYSPLQFYGHVNKVHPYDGWFLMANGEWKKRITFVQLIDVDWI